MNLTRESEYALKGLAWLAMFPVGTTVPMPEIAAEQQLPTMFLAKIFQKLARYGLLDADRGRGSGSGYRLRGEPSGIRVRSNILALAVGAMGAWILRRHPELRARIFERTAGAGN